MMNFMRINQDDFNFMNNEKIHFILENIIIWGSLVLIIVLMISVKKDVYYENSLKVINNNEVITNVNNNWKIFLDQEKMYIGEKEFSYKIESVTLNNQDIEIIMKIDLKNYNVINGIFNYKILVKQENVLNYFVRIIKGG